MSTSPLVNRTIFSCCLAYGVVTGALAAILSGFITIGPPSIEAMIYGQIPVLVMALLGLAALKYRHQAVRIVFVLLAALHLPAIGYRSGGGITDVSVVEQIRYGQFWAETGLATDISAASFVVAAIVLIVSRKRWSVD